MTNDHPFSNQIDEFLATNATEINNLIESRITEQIIDDMLDKLDDAISDEIAYPEFDISDDDNEEIAFKVKEMILARILTRYLSIAMNNDE